MAKRITNPEAVSKGMRRYPLTAKVLNGLATFVTLCDGRKWPKTAPESSARAWLERELRMSGQVVINGERIMPCD